MAFDLQQKVFRLPDSIVVSVGLRWDFIGADPVDLDLSAVCFTSEGMLLDCVFFNHPFPAGTDEAALRGSGAVVDPELLPYMFAGGDSRVGGEEENQLPGLALSARRREYQMRNTGASGDKNRELQRMDIRAAIFSRLYEAAELEVVEKALDDEECAPASMKRREFCDESVTFVMHKIPPEVDVIFLVVTSYTGADFTTLPTVKLLVVNESANEQVGVIDLKRSTGNGTANLACMLCRLQIVTPDTLEQQLWDLRELNIRTFGYTFVDMLPAMMDVLGVDEGSRGDAVRLLPDYSLTKGSSHDSNAILSDVRFGVGWDGEHDLDAFLVMLDANNCCVDYLHPKQAKLQSIYPHTARHSGDAINGFGTFGDEEFIDLMTYRMPPEVHTILFGAAYVESFGVSAGSVASIFDVPKLYLRLQNRTAECPNSLEVDRWNIHYEAQKDAKLRRENRGFIGNENGVEERQEGLVCRTYIGIDGKEHCVQMVVLGAMVKKEEVPFMELYSDGRLDQQQFLQQREEQDATDAENTRVPLFEYCPLHECIPADKTNSLASAMPCLHGIVKYRCGGGGAGTADWPGAPLQRSVPPSLWSDAEVMDTIMTLYAVRVQFLEVRNLRMTLPHRFRCHAEAWVCGGATSTRGEMTPFDTPPFRTPYLIHRDQTTWDEKNPATSAVFLVRRFDRIRVVLYEYAAFGSVDIDLIQIEELWADELRPASGDRRAAPSDARRWFPLQSGALSGGELCLHLSRVSTQSELQARAGAVERTNRAWRRAVRQRQEEKERAVRDQNAPRCSVV